MAKETEAVTAERETNREKGVHTTPCPTCGNELKQVELDDGGVTTEVCSTCSPEPEREPEKASKTQARETGTDTTNTEEQ